MPSAEVAITADLVRRLVTEQVPEHAADDIEPLAHGWDNELFRVGPDLVARLPRRLAGVALIETEQRWLPALAPTLPLPIPSPVHRGRPGAGYPWPWSLTPYLPGRSVLAATGTGDGFGDPRREAARLGAFLDAVHRVAPEGAPANPLRGVPLAARQERFTEDIGRVHDEVDVDRARRTWSDALAVPGWSGPPVWVHGDMHPGNLLTDGTAITAVVDFGDLCAGDPASDLVVAWMLFDGEARDEFRLASGADDDTWRRGLGWALALGLAILANSADNPSYATLGRRTIDAVLADHP